MIRSFSREAIGHLLDKIESLLRDEARDHSDDWQLRVFGQAKLLQQVALACGLAGNVFGRVRCRNVRVALGAPLAVIDAIHDAGHRACACAQNALQTETIFRSLDLLAVPAAHGGDVVGHSDGALQEIHLAVKFQLRHGEQVPGQHEQRQYLGREQPLIAQVVNGEDAWDVRERWVLGVQRLSAVWERGLSASRGSERRRAAPRTFADSSTARENKANRSALS